MAKEIKIGWWSAGITSAVACKLALELYDNVKLYYIETGSAHSDNKRFKTECEKWYGCKIETVKNTKGYTDHIDVIEKTGYVNGPDGARCTLELKKEVRFALENYYSGPTLFDPYHPVLTNQIFGFEFEKKEVNRAIRFMEQYKSARALVPLIERGLTKDNCAGMILNEGIELPVMYRLGYPNNNCIGCVKGGAGYWNKIRIDFPYHFNRMAAAELKVGHSCIKKTFLEDLDPTKGKKPKIVMPNCGTFCEVEAADIPHKSLNAIMNGKKSIYDHAA